MPEKTRSWKRDMIVAMISFVGGIGSVVAVKGNSGVIEPDEGPARVVAFKAQTLVVRGEQVAAIVDVELDRIGRCALREGRFFGFWSEEPDTASNRFQWVLLAPGDHAGIREAPPSWLQQLEVRTTMLTDPDKQIIQEWTFPEEER